MGYAMGATGLYITSEDMVKLGYVYLDGGRYKGTRILSEEWVNLATRHNYALDWDNEHTMFFKGGMRGQVLFSVPEQNRAVAMQSFGGNCDVVMDFVRNYRD